VTALVAALKAMLKLTAVAVGVILAFGGAILLLQHLLPQVFGNPYEPTVVIREQKEVLDKDGDDTHRKLAAEVLGDMGPRARTAIPVLIKALKDREVLVRYRAAEALGKIGTDSETVVPALVQCLTDAHPMPRAAAAESLGKYGQAAGTALPALRDLLNDKDSQARDRAAKAIAKIDPGNQEPRRSPAGTDKPQ